MLFSAQSSDQLNALSTTSLNSSLQLNSTALASSTVSAGFADPLQLSGSRLGSSASSLAATTELTPFNASLVGSNSAFDVVSNVSVFERDSWLTNNFRFDRDLIEIDSPFNQDRRHALNPKLDDTLTGAYNWKNLDGKTLSRSSSIGSSDSVDYTHFRLDQASAFNLSLKGLSGDAAVNLLNANGTTIASSYDGNRLTAQGISTTQNFDTHDISLNLSSLAAGDYYLKVSPFWAANPVGGVGGKIYLPTAVTTAYELTVSTEQVNNLLSTEVDLGSLAGTRLFTGSLDSNNTSEMYRVTLAGANNLHITLSGMNANADVRLIKDHDNDGLVSSNDVIASSNHGYSFTDGTYNGLNEGTYFIQVNQGQGAFGSAISYNLGVSTGDWYTNNLRDFGIIANARLAAKDGTFERNEMVSLLRDTKDHAVIDSTEVAELKTVLDSLGYIMPDSVRGLANKVINGDPANTRIGGSNIGNLGGNDNGNLFSSDTSERMERLIGKWFFGNDRPTALRNNQTGALSYQEVSGALFQNGVSYLDVDQGDVGDCYFLVDLAATALQSPNTITNMFTDNRDGTFTVRLFNNGVADYVTVDRWLPVDSRDGAAFAGWGGGASTNSANELWVALAEKAYAQFNESGWIGQDGTNSYNGTMIQATAVRNNGSGINGGPSSIALAQITGQATISQGLGDQQITSMIDHFNTNRMVTITTPVFRDAEGAEMTINGNGIVGNHVYALLDYNAVTDQFRVFNPWNYNDDATAERWISRDTLRSNFVNWSALA